MLHIVSSFSLDSSLLTALHWFADRISLLPFDSTSIKIKAENAEACFRTLQYNSNKDAIMLILIRVQDFIDYDEINQPSLAFEQSKGNIEILSLQISDFIAEHQETAVLCIVPDDPDFCQNQNYHSFSKSQKLTITQKLKSYRNAHILNSCDLEKQYQVKPASIAYYPSIAAAISRQLYAIKAPPYKAIVVDCDNTLWDGIAGEIGIENVVISPEKKRFQEFLVTQANAGKLICLCSKNDESTVKNVFACHKEKMPLKWENILTFRINWNPKSTNIISIAQEYNFALDSIIFIDDDDLECQEMREQCPAVLTIQAPVNPNNIWPLDLSSTITETDRCRLQTYREYSSRQQILTTTATYQEFVESLGLKVDVTPAQSADVKRIIQLASRTNQFVTNKTEYSQQDIQQNCFVIRANDKFSDFGGIIGAFFVDTQNPDTLIVSNFFMSCRAMGRTIEHRAFQQLANIVRNLGKTAMEVILKKTDRNNPVQNFLKSIAIEHDGKFSINIEEPPNFIDYMHICQPNTPKPSVSSPRPDNKSLALLATLDNAEKLHKAILLSPTTWSPKHFTKAGGITKTSNDNNDQANTKDFN